MKTISAERKTATSDSPPSVPRPRLKSTLSRRTSLDGAWRPRSTDPVAELPGLILAVDDRRGPVTHVMLDPAGWGSQPRRLGVAGRVVRLGWFSSQPRGLLTAIRTNGDRIDLLVVAPTTAPATARAPINLAAQATNSIHAPDILTAVTDHLATEAETAPETTWESEGGHLQKSGV